MQFFVKKSLFSSKNKFHFLFFLLNRFFTPKSTNFYKELNSEPREKMVDFLKPQTFWYYEKYAVLKASTKCFQTNFCCFGQCVQPAMAVLYLKNIFVYLHNKELTQKYGKN